MGNQARVGDSTTVVSTSTRNFPNRLGKGANVYLASAELAAVSAILGKVISQMLVFLFCLFLFGGNGSSFFSPQLPSPAEYLKYAGMLSKDSADTYRYLNFNELPEYTKVSKIAK